MATMNQLPSSTRAFPKQRKESLMFVAKSLATMTLTVSFLTIIFTRTAFRATKMQETTTYGKTQVLHLASVTGVVQT